MQHCAFAPCLYCRSLTPNPTLSTHHRRRQARSSGSADSMRAPGIGCLRLRARVPARGNGRCLAAHELMRRRGLPSDREWAGEAGAAAATTAASTASLVVPPPNCGRARGHNEEVCRAGAQAALRALSAVVLPASSAASTHGGPRGPQRGRRRPRLYNDGYLRFLVPKCVAQGK